MLPTREITFSINGAPRRANVPLDMSALTLIRDVLGLTGTKYGCGEGECGACTILVDGQSVNACLMFAVDCEGRSLTTIEGMAITPAGERLRDAFVAHGAVQCGFCTPGIVMQAAALLAQDAHPTNEQIRRGIEGNLCRCTGYAKIVEAIAAAAETR
ncbi:MAG TPA: (2Fe-2S)-binding protein [Casimicrobiaceae bacterium]|nr:(2Fe-2S)-binding protein [Casimicrobiaceae bacterium]